MWCGVYGNSTFKEWQKAIGTERKEPKLRGNNSKNLSVPIWECRGCIRDRVSRNAAKPCNTGVCWFCPSCWKRHKNSFDHINDHRQKNLSIAQILCYNVQNQISGYSAVGSALDLGSRGRAFESLYSDQMNEPLFSNIFIEKRGFSTWKALRYKGFLSLHLINAPAKIPKCQTIIERNSFFEWFFRKTGFFFW